MSPNPKDEGRGGAGAVGLSAAFILLFWTAFHVAWPLILVAVSPLALMMVSARRGWMAAALAVAAGTLFWAWGESFLSVYNVTGLWLLAGWQGLTIGLVALSTRWWHARFGLPLTLVLPFTWVGAEYLRLLGPFGFPIAALAAPCYRQLWMIQVCDLGGIYALSVPIAMANGLVADLWLDRHRLFPLWRAWPGKLRAAVMATGAIWLAVAGYGDFRLAEGRQTITKGPLISVVQPDVVYANNIADGFDPDLLRQQMQALSEEAVRQPTPPRLVVWPEGIGPMAYRNRELLDGLFDENLTAALLGFGQAGDLAATNRAKLRDIWQELLEPLRQSEAEFQQWVARLKVPVLVGGLALLPSTNRTETAWQAYNAAILYTPQAGQSPQKQFKNRLFPMQEWVPWPGTAVNRWLRDSIARRGRISRQFWLTPGRTREIFQLPSEDPAAVPARDAPTGLRHAPPAASSPGAPRYIVSMCSESLFPDSTASFLSRADGAKPVDLLINIGNEGGFQRNRELPLHFALLAFRAVEARVGVAQSANAGISGFVKPTGEIYGLVTNRLGQHWTGKGAPELPLIANLVQRRTEHAEDISRSPELARQVRAAVARIEEIRHEVGITGQSTQPVYLDSRGTFYSRHRDLLPPVLLALLGVGVAGAYLGGIPSRKARS